MANQFSFIILLFFVLYFDIIITVIIEYFSLQRLCVRMCMWIDHEFTCHSFISCARSHPLVVCARVIIFASIIQQVLFHFNTIYHYKCYSTYVITITHGTIAVVVVDGVVVVKKKISKSQIERNSSLQHLINLRVSLLQMTINFLLELFFLCFLWTSFNFQSKKSTLNISKHIDHTLTQNIRIE